MTYDNCKSCYGTGMVSEDGVTLQTCECTEYEETHLTDKELIVLHDAMVNTHYGSGFDFGFLNADTELEQADISDLF